jgi:hypothetical protein
MVVQNFEVQIQTVVQDIILKILFSYNRRMEIDKIYYTYIRESGKWNIITVRNKDNLFLTA